MSKFEDLRRAVAALTALDDDEEARIATAQATKLDELQRELGVIIIGYLNEDQPDTPVGLAAAALATILASMIAQMGADSRQGMLNLVVSQLPAQVAFYERDFRLAKEVN